MTEFDDNRFEIVFDHERRPVPPKPWELLGILRKHPNRFVSLDRLHIALYGAETEARSDDTVRAHIRRLRAALVGTGYRIAGRYGVGYCLERAPMIGAGS